MLIKNIYVYMYIYEVSPNWHQTKDISRCIYIELPYHKFIITNGEQLKSGGNQLNELIGSFPKRFTQVLDNNNSNTIIASW